LINWDSRQDILRARTRFEGNLQSGEIRWRIKGALPQYALSLLSTIRRGGRAELPRAEPSDTELRTQRGEPLRESSLRRPRIWTLSRIGTSGYRFDRVIESSRSKKPEIEARSSYDVKKRLEIPQSRIVFTSPERVPRSDIPTWFPRRYREEHQLNPKRKPREHLSKGSAIVC